MIFLQPIADFLSQYWWVWLASSLFLFGIRVRLIFRGENGESARGSGRFLRNAIESAMWSFGILFALSLFAIVGQGSGFL